MRAFSKILTIFTLGVMMFSPTLASAGAGHSHGPSNPPADKQIIERATEQLSKAIDKGFQIKGKEIEQAWNTASDKKVFKKSLRHYIVSFDEETMNKTLYVFINRQGYFSGANFDGSNDGLR